MMSEGYDKERIDALRKEVFANNYDYSEFGYWFFKSLRETNPSRAYALRIGDAIYDIFDKSTPVIREGELIVGRNFVWKPSPEEEAEWKLLREYGNRIYPALHGQGDHMAIDYDLLLNRGALGIMEDIKKRRAALDLTLIPNIEKDNFYACCLRSLEGLIRFSERYAEEAERQAASCASPQRKAELLRIAEITRKVPANPAGGFYEAVQSTHFTTFALSAKPFACGVRQFQLGRPDRYLWKFYEADLKAGKIKPEEAQTLVDCLAICINNRVPSGLSSGYMVGGRDKTGALVSNDLTRMLIKA
ncbi:MAG: pyruvate formate lyase family protein, partial [Treponema sp.]|nr:pyruvate formate lyase family protein [Treponema sp.]